MASPSRSIAVSCPACTFLNPPTCPTCRMCAAPLTSPPPTDSTIWRCALCTLINGAAATHCSACNSARPSLSTAPSAHLSPATAAPVPRLTSSNRLHVPSVSPPSRSASSRRSHSGRRRSRSPPSDDDEDEEDDDVSTHPSASPP